MRPTWIIFTLLLLGFLTISPPLRADDEPRDTVDGDIIEPDSLTIALLNRTLEVLSMEDDAERLNAFLPLVHKDHLTPDGRDLKQMTKRYSYKKAYNAAGLYKLPVEITRIAESRIKTIGWKQTLERGRIVTYWLAKRDGVPGLPAPVQLFFPEDGGPAKVHSVGSL